MCVCIPSSLLYSSPFCLFAFFVKQGITSCLIEENSQNMLNGIPVHSCIHLGRKRLIFSVVGPIFVEIHIFKLKLVQFPPNIPSLNIFYPFFSAAVLADCSAPNFFAFNGGSQCCDAETVIGSTRFNIFLYYFYVARSKTFQPHFSCSGSSVPCPGDICSDAGIRASLLPEPIEFCIVWYFYFSRPLQTVGNSWSQFKRPFAKW